MLDNLYSLEQMAHQVPQDRLNEARRQSTLRQALSSLHIARQPVADEAQPKAASAPAKDRASWVLQMLGR